MKLYKNFQKEITFFASKRSPEISWVCRAPCRTMRRSRPHVFTRKVRLEVNLKDVFARCNSFKHVWVGYLAMSMRTCFVDGFEVYAEHFVVEHFASNILIFSSIIFCVEHFLVDHFLRRTFSRRSLYLRRSSNIFTSIILTSIIFYRSFEGSSDWFSW